MAAIEWEVSIIELSNAKTRYNVTRRIPSLSISETKIFLERTKALQQVNEWLAS